jgi:hypothetical protein
MDLSASINKVAKIARHVIHSSFLQKHERPKERRVRGWAQISMFLIFFEK